MTELSWGYRYLMCPPDHFDVVYEINSWMHTSVRVDRDRAAQQWEGLVATLRSAGASVEVLPPQPGLPDMVFSANAGVVNGAVFVPARFRHPQRRGEEPFDIDWFEGHGFEVLELPPTVFHEGAGDALPFGDGLLSGYRGRSDAAAHAMLGSLVGLPVRSIELVDDRLYHFDLTFCPLSSTHALVAPMGWDRYAWQVVSAVVPSPIVLEPDEAFAFCANSVVVGTTVVMATCPVRLGRVLEDLGFSVVECDVSEFLKAGGGCRCLTLALDVSLPAPG